MRGKGERRLDDALVALASALDSTGAPWMVIGGIAVIARGVRRLTTDIDVVVRGDAIRVEPLLRTLARQGVKPRVADAVGFARENLVLLLRHQPSGVDLDLSFGWTSFEHEAIAASTKTAFGSTRLPMARAEDLIIFKAMAGRPRDIEDATALMLMHPAIDLRRVRRRLAELATMAGEPELLDGLEKVAAHVRSVRAATRARLARRRRASTRSKTQRRS